MTGKYKEQCLLGYEVVQLLELRHGADKIPRMPLYYSQTKRCRSPEDSALPICYSQTS